VNLQPLIFHVVLALDPVNESVALPPVKELILLKPFAAVAELAARLTETAEL